MHLFFFLLAALLGVAKYIESNYVTDSTRLNFRHYLRGWHERANTPSITKLLQNNFLLLSHFFDKIYGSKILTKKFVSSTFFITYFYILFVIIVSAILPNSALAMRPTPSEVFDGAAKSVPLLIQNYQKYKANPKAPTLSPKQELYYTSLLLKLQKDDTPFNRWLFTVLCAFGFWLLASILNVMSLIFCRLLLRELALTDGLIIMVTSLLFNIVAITVFYAFGIVIICSILFPPLGFLISVTLFKSLMSSSYLCLWLACTYAFTGCALSPVWMKALVLFSLAPLVAIIICIFATIVTKPYKKAFYGKLNRACIFIIEHKHGPLAFIFSTLSLLVGGISTLASLLKW